MQPVLAAFVTTLQLGTLPVCHSLENAQGHCQVPVSVFFFSFEPIFEALIALEVFLCSDIFLGRWLSFEPIFEAQLALEVPQRAYRPPFPDPSPSRDRRFDLPGSVFEVVGRGSTPFFRQCSENDHRSTHSTREAKNWSFWVQTGSLEHWRSRHFGLLSRPGPCGSHDGELCLACSQFWRP